MAKVFALVFYVSIATLVLAGSLEHSLLRRQETDDQLATTVSAPGKTSTTVQVITSTLKPTVQPTTSQPRPTTPNAPGSSKQATQETTSPTARNNPTSPTARINPTSTQGNSPTAVTPQPDQPSDADTNPTPVTLSPSTRRVVATIYSTISSGKVAVQVSTILFTSTTVETPVVPGATSSDQAQSGGSKPVTRITIIGVVVGVGGAFLVGGLAIFAWRLRKRRVNPVDEDDLMRRDGSPLAVGMRNISPETSPFKATLDQYHKPPGTVNASSNF